MRWDASGLRMAPDQEPEVREEGNEGRRGETGAHTLTPQSFSVNAHAPALIGSSNTPRVAWPVGWQVDPRRKEPEKPERFPVRLPVIETQTGQIDVLSRLLKVGRSVGPSPVSP